MARDTELVYLHLSELFELLSRTSICISASIDEMFLGDGCKCKGDCKVVSGCITEQEFGEEPCPEEAILGMESGWREASLQDAVNQKYLRGFLERYCTGKKFLVSQSSPEGRLKWLDWEVGYVLEDHLDAHPATFRLYVGTNGMVVAYAGDCTSTPEWRIDLKLRVLVARCC
ncbi:MAG: hypothetical protein QF829_00965 [Candidatus Hydrothermarchaeota archaeon]|jgi:hypothetical protein|nr:hypothetical protein [Candidatus Hydrothermarchaeota archaeon]